MVAVEKTGEAA